MNLHQFLNPPEISPEEFMRNAMRGILPSDPLGDLALEIVDEIKKETQDLETSWHDGALTDSVIEIIKEHLNKLDPS